MNEGVRIATRCALARRIRQFQLSTRPLISKLPRRNTLPAKTDITSPALSYQTTTMATVIRELWGHHPAFLQRANQHRNLIELIAHAPNRGAGLRVTPTEWYQRGWSDAYWTVKNIVLEEDLAHGEVFGQLTWQGRPKGPASAKIPSIYKKKWHLYEAPEELRALERKLRL
ncbi:uncharacterized protein EV422DRAFT_514889, partial [Fimicolochytrium jonesii]|uniref:uncharacterized protein n=1 Tax=Fimicolochytrium jonesii TaxID=1396493 RepID=UPI0022FE0759